MKSDTLLPRLIRAIPAFSKGRTMLLCSSLGLLWPAQPPSIHPLPGSVFSTPLPVLGHPRVGGGRGQTGSSPLHGPVPMMLSFPIWLPPIQFRLRAWCCHHWCTDVVFTYPLSRCVDLILSSPIWEHHWYRRGRLCHSEGCQQGRFHWLSWSAVI